MIKMQPRSMIFQISVFSYFVYLFLRTTPNGFFTLRFTGKIIYFPFSFFSTIWFHVDRINFDYFSQVKLFFSESLKMFQECFCMFPNYLETRLLLFVLDHYFNLWQQKCNKKVICFNIILKSLNGKKLFHIL